MKPKNWICPLGAGVRGCSDHAAQEYRESASQKEHLPSAGAWPTVALPSWEQYLLGCELEAPLETPELPL